MESVLIKSCNCKLIILTITILQPIFLMNQIIKLYYQYSLQLVLDRRGEIQSQVPCAPCLPYLWGGWGFRMCTIDFQVQKPSLFSIPSIIIRCLFDTLLLSPIFWFCLPKRQSFQMIFHQNYMFHWHVLLCLLLWINLHFLLLQLFCTETVL